MFRYQWSPWDNLIIGATLTTPKLALSVGVHPPCVGGNHAWITKTVLYGGLAFLVSGCFTSVRLPDDRHADILLDSLGANHRFSFSDGAKLWFEEFKVISPESCKDYLGVALQCDGIYQSTLFTPPGDLIHSPPRTTSWAHNFTYQTSSLAMKGDFVATATGIMDLRTGATNPLWNSSFAPQVWVGSRILGKTFPFSGIRAIDPAIASVVNVPWQSHVSQPCSSGPDIVGATPDSILLLECSTVRAIGGRWNLVGIDWQGVPIPGFLNWTLPSTTGQSHPFVLRPEGFVLAVFGDSTASNVSAIHLYDAKTFQPTHVVPVPGANVTFEQVTASTWGWVAFAASGATWSQRTFHLIWGNWQGQILGQWNEPSFGTSEFGLPAIALPGGFSYGTGPGRHEFFHPI